MWHGPQVLHGAEWQSQVDCARSLNSVWFLGAPFHTLLMGFLIARQAQSYQTSHVSKSRNVKVPLLLSLEVAAAAAAKSLQS